MVLGAARSNRLAKKAGKVTANELKNTVINTNSAPVLDVNNNQVIVISLRNPYDFKYIKKTQVFITT